jgi:hypothetical protein
MAKVTGRKRATAMAADRPGMEPNTMPTATPTISSRMDMGFIIPANAFPIRDKVSISCASF